MDIVAALEEATWAISGSRPDCPIGAAERIAGARNESGLRATSRYQLRNRGSSVVISCWRPCRASWRSSAIFYDISRSSLGTYRRDERGTRSLSHPARIGHPRLGQLTEQDASWLTPDLPRACRRPGSAARIYYASRPPGPACVGQPADRRVVKGKTAFSLSSLAPRRGRVFGGGRMPGSGAEDFEMRLI